MFFVFAVTKKRDSRENVKPAKQIERRSETQMKTDNQVENSDLPLFTRWENFSKKDGLPSNKANCVRIDQNRVLVGTDKGLAIYQNNIWKVLTTEDGLSHNNILSIDVSELTGEVWLATLSGLDRWSAGKFEIYNQFNSGLANDVVYTVICDKQFVWTATAAGASMYDIYTNTWKIFNEQNAPMHEPWTYGVCNGDDKIYIAAWGGGVIEYHKKTGHFRDHTDPDHEMEIDLFPDDGIVHDITTGVTYQNGILWVGTYFGMSRYDGVHWQSYFDNNSGLASNFINFVKAQGPVVYVCTDKGFSTFNSSTWATYYTQDTNGEIRISDGESKKTMNTTTSMPSNYIWGMDVKGDEIWLATANGVSRSKSSGKAELDKRKL